MYAVHILRMIMGSVDGEFLISKEVVPINRPICAEVFRTLRQARISFLDMPIVRQARRHCSLICLLHEWLAYCSLTSLLHGMESYLSYSGGYASLHQLPAIVIS